MNRLLGIVVFSLWISGVVSSTHTTASQDNEHASIPISSSTRAPITTHAVPLDPSGSTVKSRNLTCPNRTVNYITHTLPRQCLRRDRAAPGLTQSSDSNSTVANSSSPRISDTSDTISQQVKQTVSTNTPVANHMAATTGVKPADSDLSTTSAAETSPAPESTSPSATLDEDSESPLDTANFLSFEEWKKQNLAKLGQSPEDVGRLHPVNPNRPRPGINNALESLGEENELELDFAGFGSASAVPPNQADGAPRNAEIGVNAGSQSASAVMRSKDAGKTCKERSNYASFDCSATVLKTNKECKSASSILVESKDSYMLNTCSAKNKFIIVQLCNDIQIDTVVLANYEFFSGTFRHFRVSVSDRYPVEMEKWRDLGTFEGRNTREIQAFLVENPLIWAKYLRIEFLSHYGTEYYCPVTLLRVHGTTMIEDYRHEEDLARGEQAQATLEAEVSPMAPVAQPPLPSTDEAIKGTVQELPRAVEDNAESLRASSESATPSTTPVKKVNEEQDAKVDGASPADETLERQVGVYSPSNANMTCDNPAVDPDTDHDATRTKTIPVSPSEPSASSSAIKEQSHSEVLSNSRHVGSPGGSAEPSPAHEQPPQPLHSSTEQPVQRNTMHGGSPENATSTLHSATSVNSTAAIAGNNHSSVATNATRTHTSSSLSAQPAQPSTQESFFKSFHKRLQQLESNSTLSLKYIEEQSRILRDAFGKVEKRQVASTTKFLSQLNETVMAELHSFRQAYDQLWQGTVIELDGQRETYQREMLALSSRLTLVADELVWQKRMGIVQSTLLLLCLVMALFGRSTNGYLEVPLMQQIAALKGGWESPPDSPSPDSRSPVSLFRKRIWRSKTEPSGESTHLMNPDDSGSQHGKGVNIHVEPPSPNSYGPRSDEDQHYHEHDGSPEVYENKGNMPAETAVSPKKNRKKPRKPHNVLLENGRVRSPLAMQL